MILLFRDGHCQVVELPEKLFVGPDLVYCGLPERDPIFTLPYTNCEATFLKRFTFGGAIMHKFYYCIPPKSKVLFFELDTPAEPFIKSLSRRLEAEGGEESEGCGICYAAAGTGNHFLPRCSAVRHAAQCEMHNAEMRPCGFPKKAPLNSHPAQTGHQPSN